MYWKVLKAVLPVQFYVCNSCENEGAHRSSPEEDYEHIILRVSPSKDWGIF
jgi:hypothetical protein